ncbi:MULTISPECIES: hypothetical protein [unclassified Mesorhizobium]|uniref:hypothetical protein n=1 Tax=unclassified Mesorhizobium TaxID=325217 RepID=UPI000FCCAE19|nr:MULTISPECIES: hypothetical protein [unclassified Mesorhizobium]RUW30581.1 hypothetical protein EOA38_20080 [Mesorhizobium sp. M1E.F.Ca.ET.041.01.1.1]RWD88462.1 MAG: hypothetical protein EOS38_15320 [Mesorhizobium sp.]RWD94403.1 MAG: hypothetical protein EOS39_08060 [Mesorhizobium sp.]TIU32964.1 MAG: hypothetical protein E5W38_10935 [Mesorhizobium sp.]TIV48884.1 MAG: hypothetical protein E5V88_27270 [Mesorhizobium sp.]
MIDSGFETKSLRMELLLLVTFQAPAADVERIMEAVVAITPLRMGKYDGNAYQSAQGIERYRTLEGAAAGAEIELRRRPGTVEVSFELPDDQALAARVVEAIYQAHSYEEPVIRLQPLLASRSKGLDDRANPNRWWNTTGDWKQSASPVRESA